MKERNQALEKLMSWARQAQRERAFELSPQVRASVLAAWRRDSANELNEAILRFLRWAVAYSVVIMAISIFFSQQQADNEGLASHDGSPHTAFHSRMSGEIYGP